jgi:hypothetical protein
MCDVNHQANPRPGYLIDAKAESVAADGALWTRALAHHGQVKLSDDQIRGLLDLSREYHAAQLAIRLRMAVLGERVEQKRGRLDAEALAVRKPLLDERAELFRADEELFFDFAARGQQLLTDEQLELIKDPARPAYSPSWIAGRAAPPTGRRGPGGTTNRETAMRSSRDDPPDQRPGVAAWLPEGAA